MVTLLSGLVGGLLATIGMTMFVMALGDDSPSTAALWEKFVVDKPNRGWQLSTSKHEQTLLRYSHNN